MPLFNTFTQLSSWAFVSVLEDHGSALPAWTWHLRIWWNSRWVSPFRFVVSVPGWMSPSRLGATIPHPSIIPQPSRPSSPGKMSPGGCDHGGACSTGIYACATCAHDDASGVCGPCGADPISRVTWKDDVAALGGSGFGFLHLTVSGLQLRIFQGHERLIYHCSRGESMWNTISSTGISIKTKGIK